MSKTKGKNKFAAYPRLNPLGIGKNISAADLIDQTFLAYNGGRLREASKLLTEKMLPNDGYIGMSLTGALTPAGLGKSCLIPLMKAGFIDWIISTGRQFVPRPSLRPGHESSSRAPLFWTTSNLHKMKSFGILTSFLNTKAFRDTDPFCA